MKTPTSNEIRIAVHVLQALSERIHTNAADQVMHLSESTYGDHQAARIESRTLERSGRINDVIGQLNDWKETLRESRGIRV
ncbi:MAG: hypothetical protein L0Z50_39965 [Verrucomicrobiales bacterium]|nr:hypothetical protein [Verrucomicrobiales bacterium]